jgi:hypothetical protein
LSSDAFNWDNDLGGSIRNARRDAVYRHLVEELPGFGAAHSEHPSRDTVNWEWERQAFDDTWRLSLMIRFKGAVVRDVHVFTGWKEKEELDRWFFARVNDLAQRLLLIA